MAEQKHPQSFSAIPERIRAQSADIWNDHMRCVWRPEICLRAAYGPGSIDPLRLRRAARLLVDAEPVLGCRWVPRWIRPYWQRLDAGQLDRIRLLEVVESPLNEPAYQSFLVDVLDYRVGPQLQLRLHRQPNRDEILLKVNHQVADAESTKLTLVRLAELYRRLGDDPDHRPTVNQSTRSLRPVFAGMLPRKAPALLRRYVEGIIALAQPPDSVGFPATRGGGEVRWLFHRYSAERLALVRHYARLRGATFNDVLVTAFLRALVGMFGWTPTTEGLRLSGTADLRRYLPRGAPQAICNLSSFYTTRLHENVGADFGATLARVKAHIDTLKASNIGLPHLFGSYVMTACLPAAVSRRLEVGFATRGAFEKQLLPILTNGGVLDPAALSLGEPLGEPLEAELVVLESIPPSMVFGASRYRGVLTLSIGLDTASVEPAKIRDFLARVDAELDSVAVTPPAPYETTSI